jgi:hypothetical protein
MPIGGGPARVTQLIPSALPGQTYGSFAGKPPFTPSTVRARRTPGLPRVGSRTPSPRPRVV